MAEENIVAQQLGMEYEEYGWFDHLHCCMTCGLLKTSERTFCIGRLRVVETWEQYDPEAFQRWISYQPLRFNVHTYCSLACFEHAAGEAEGEGYTRPSSELYPALLKTTQYPYEMQHVEYGWLDPGDCCMTCGLLRTVERQYYFRGFREVDTFEQYDPEAYTRCVPYGPPGSNHYNTYTYCSSLCFLNGAGHTEEEDIRPPSPTSTFEK